MFLLLQMLLRASRLKANSRAKLILGLQLLPPPWKCRANNPARGKSRPHLPQTCFWDSTAAHPAFLCPVAVPIQTAIRQQQVILSVSSHEQPWQHQRRTGGPGPVPLSDWSWNSGLILYPTQHSHKCAQLSRRCIHFRSGRH